MDLENVILAVIGLGVIALLVSLYNWLAKSKTQDALEIAQEEARQNAKEQDTSDALWEHPAPVEEANEVASPKPSWMKKRWLPKALQKTNSKHRSKKNKPRWERR